MLKTWLAYIAIVFFVSATPGPVMMLAMANGGLYGVKKACLGILGTSTGNLLLMAISATALATTLKTSPHILDPLKLAGAIYLIYLGQRMYRTTVPPNVETSAFINIHSNMDMFCRGFIIAASNPKGIIFFGALFPQFIASDNTFLFQFIILAVTFLFMDAAWQLLYARGGGIISKMPGNPRITSRISGCIIAICGIAIVCTYFEKFLNFNH